MTATSGRKSEDETILGAFRRFATDCLAIIKDTSGPLRQRIIASKARIGSLASHESLLQILLADPRACAHARQIVFRGDGAPLNYDDLKTFFENDVLLKLLENYTSQPGGVEFDAARFDEVYRTTEAALLNDCHLVNSLAPLFSFIGPASPIRLDDESVIRLATYADFATLASRASVPGIDLGEDQARWIVETESRISGVRGVGVPCDLERLEDILTAIRLTADGGAHCRFLFSTRKHDLSASSLAPLPSAHVGSPTDITSEKSVACLVNVFKILRSLKPPSLRFALRRFNQAFERTQVEDRLVDLVIVLESLLVRDGNLGEVAYKFRIRAAAFLGDGEGLESKRNIMDIVKTAYDFRSSIVHGTPQEPGKVRKKLSRLDIWNPADLTNRIESYAREALRRLLPSPNLGNPKSLDDRLLS